MRILVCGGRDYGRKWDYGEARWRIDVGLVRWSFRFLNRAIESSGAKEVEIIHGKAPGADSVGEGFVRYVKRNPSLFQYTIRENPFPADWKQYGRRAGPIRNQQMLDEGKPHAVIAFPGGTGTAHMMKISRKSGVPVYEVRR